MTSTEDSTRNIGKDQVHDKESSFRSELRYHCRLDGALRARLSYFLVLHRYHRPSVITTPQKKDTDLSMMQNMVCTALSHTTQTWSIQTTWHHLPKCLVSYGPVPLGAQFPCIYMKCHAAPKSSSSPQLFTPPPKKKQTRLKHHPCIWNRDLSANQWALWSPSLTATLPNFPPPFTSTLRLSIPPPSSLLKFLETFGEFLAILIYFTSGLLSQPTLGATALPPPTPCQACRDHHKMNFYYQITFMYVTKSIDWQSRVWVINSIELTVSRHYCY